MLQVTDAAILDHIARLPHARATFKQLVRELGSRGPDREELDAALDRLTQRGQLVEVKSGHFVVTRLSREYAVGRLNMHRDGYGFLIADHPIEGLQGDVYVPRDSAQKAMHGDRVVVHIARIESDGRADGEIIQVLRRAHQTVVGEFRLRKRGSFVVPHDDRIHQWKHADNYAETEQHLTTSQSLGFIDLQGFVQSVFEEIFFSELIERFQ